VTAAIACIVADWGTTNLRAWAMGADAPRWTSAAALRSDGGRGVVASRKPWRSLQRLARQPTRLPVVMSGMVGSKLGWKEAPYLGAPVALDGLRAISAR